MRKTTIWWNFIFDLIYQKHLLHNLNTVSIDKKSTIELLSSELGLMRIWFFSYDCHKIGGSGEWGRCVNFQLIPCLVDQTQWAPTSCTTSTWATRLPGRPQSSKRPPGRSFYTRLILRQKNISRKAAEDLGLPGPEALPATEEKSEKKGGKEEAEEVESCLWSFYQSTMSHPFRGYQLLTLQLIGPCKLPDPAMRLSHAEVVCHAAFVYSRS